ncbi:hypothetical protein COV16_06835 [Candidatus Woesearchaeota archaeon CG10_big_fil_rev_8_21_14_0_10_34_8]|nr:MAG: hypothetical protein COV16_06835 [Candidatus Woesearchaeota archaeon CG10_big_fil_rev_8_21_14_0_10_34_8]
MSVLFEKPKHSSIISKGFTAVDMHNHSQYSDTTTKISNIAKRARKLGIGVALTDHNEVAGNIRLSEENPDLLVIPGLEITTKEMAHVLAYFHSHSEMQNFFDKHIKDSRGGNPYLATEVSINDLADIRSDYNCVLAPAHPFAFPKRFSFFSAMKRGNVNIDILKSFGAIEVICGANVRSMNKKAVEWSDKEQKGKIGGSDAHVLGNLGDVVTISEASDIQNFLDAVEKKYTYVVGREARLHQRPVPMAKIACKNLRFFRPTMKSQYELSVKAPVANAREVLKTKINPEKREEHREQMKIGLVTLAEELNFNGYPKIKRRVKL